MTNNIFFIVGPSGSGKTTILNDIRKDFPELKLIEMCSSIDLDEFKEILFDNKDFEYHLLYVTAPLRERAKRKKLGLSFNECIEEREHYLEFVSNMIEDTPKHIHFNYFNNENGNCEYIIDSIKDYIMSKIREEKKVC